MDYNYRFQKNTRKLEESIEETLKECLDYCLSCFSNWDLPGLYRGLRTLRRIISLIIEKNKFEELCGKFDKLEQVKRDFEKEEKNEEKKNKYFNECDKIFIYVATALKEEEIIFSKKESYGEGSKDEVEEWGDDEE